MKYSCTRRLVAEAVGSAFLLAAVVGSGIAGARFSDGGALVLLPHALATGGILFVMIKLLGPISGGHFNPAVTLAFLSQRKIGVTEAGLYVLAQLVGGAIGVLLVHLTFAETVIQISGTARSGFPLLLSEFLVTFGFVGTVMVMARRGPDAVAVGIGAYTAIAIWSSASTCFANPSVTINRILTDSVTGIAPMDAAGFVIVQLLAGLAAAYGSNWLFRRADKKSS